MQTEEVVVIGSGCAGWTAALYVARANLRPLVLAGTMPGGLLTTTSIVENFPGFPEGIDGTDLMMRMQAQAERFGARVEYGTLEAAKFSDQHAGMHELTFDGKTLRARAVILATGSSHKHLGLEGERVLEKKGVTYCATCDGALPMFRDQPLVVVGGGDSACEEALYLTRFASQVHLVHRRDALRASKIMQERTLAHTKIKMEWNSTVEEILGAEQDKVTAVRLKDLKTNATRELPAAGVFIAIGHEPNTAVFRGQIDLDTDGYIKAVGFARTNRPGVFVAGDVADRVYRQAITAAGTGCAAGIEAERYLAEVAE